MAIILTDQELINAKRDIDDIGKAVNKKEVVHPRYGDSFKSLPMIIDEFQISSDAAEAAAITAVESANIAQSSSQIAQDSAALAELAATAANISGKVYATPEAGVDPVTGVADGAYFNVRSSSDESYVDEYQNVGGVPTPSGKSYPSAQAVVEVQQIVAAVGETVASVDGKLKRENISVWDFFTPAELSSYKAAPITFDAIRPVQEFFTYVANNDVGDCYASGEFRVSNTIYIGGTSAIKTRKYNGLMTLYALNAIDKVAVVNLGTLVVWSGGIMVYGTGSTSFASRTCRVGIAFGGDSDRTCVDFLFARSFYEVGVQFYNKSTLANIGTVKSIDCGSGLVNTGFSLTSTYTLDSNTGSQGSAAQQSILSVPTLPPVNIETIPNCVIGDQVYTIQNVDRVNNKIMIHPWIDSTITTGTLRYAFGGGLDVNGGDSSVLNIGVADLMRNGVGYNVRCLYPPKIAELCCQSNGLGIVVGNTTTQAIVGGVISQYYCEGNNYDLIPMSRGTQGFTIQSTIAFNYAKIRYVAPRTSANTYSAGFLGLFGININDNGVIRRRVKSPENFQGSSFAVNVVNDVLPVTIRRDVAVITLESDIDRNAAFGTDSTHLTVLGTSSASGYKPTSVTFNPSSGYTVNGSASAVFNGFADVPTFSVFLDVAAKNYIVTLLNSYQAKSATVTYDPPSLAAGERTPIQTITVTGAVLGDNVNMSFNKDLQGLSLVGYVSAAGTVSYYFENRTNATVDLVSGTVKAKIV